MHFVIEEMIGFAGQLVDSVHIDGPQGMFLVDGQVVGPSINLAGAGKDDADFGIMQAAGLQDRELRPGVDFQVRLRISHRVHVTRLAGEVEEEVLALDEVREAVRVAHVGDVQMHGCPEPGQIMQIATVLGDQAVDQRHFRTEPDQPPRQV